MNASARCFAVALALTGPLCLAQDAGVPPPPWTGKFAFPSEQAPPSRSVGHGAETRVLVDRQGAGAEQASLLLVTANRSVEISPHRHPAGAELVYLLEGAARVRGTGRDWVDLKPGDAVYLPAGVAHGWKWSGRKQSPTKLLFLHAPPLLGEEAVNVPPAKLEEPDPTSPQPQVRSGAAASQYVIAGGKASVRILFDRENAPDGSGYVGLLQAQEGMEVPLHTHEKEAELLYIVSGRGQMSLDEQHLVVSAGMAIHLPARHRHSLKVTQALEAVQFYAPSGPEQRFKKTR